MLNVACPVCRQSHPDQECCPQCGICQIIAAQRPPHIPVAGVGDRLGVVWSASLDAANGWQHPRCLLDPVRQAQLPLNAVLENPGLDPEARPRVCSAVRLLDDIKSFVDTRRVADLNQAWVELVPTMESLRGLLEELGTDSEREGKGNQPVLSSARSSGSWDKVDPFTDPDE